MKIHVHTVYGLIKILMDSETFVRNTNLNKNSMEWRVKIMTAEENLVMQRLHLNVLIAIELFRLVLPTFCLLFLVIKIIVKL